MVVVRGGELLGQVLVQRGSVIGQTVNHKALKLLLHCRVQNTPGELQELWNVVVEDELLGGDTSQGPVAQGVVKLAVFFQLSQTTPSIAKHQHTRLIRQVSSRSGTTVENIHLSSGTDLSPGLTGSCLTNDIN